MLSRLAAFAALTAVAACGLAAAGLPASAAADASRSTTFRASPAPGLHHELRATLAPDRHRLSVEDTVTLSPELRARLGAEVVFELHAGLAPRRVGAGAPLARERGGRARGAEDGGRRDGAPRESAVPLERWAVRLRDGERSFTVRYAGALFHPIRSGEEYARSMGETPGLVSSEGAILSGDSAWIPGVADELLTFTLEARAPAGWEVVSQGARTLHERRATGTVARWESAEPQQEVFLVAGRLFERARRAGRLEVQTFLRDDDEELAASYLAAAEQYLALYERLLGPYPYPKFALVENFWETGYGMPSFTLLGSKVIRLPFILHSSYPHEILHNWWGNGVFVAAQGGNWSEGLTAYLADHLVKEQRGEGAEYRRTALQRYADYVSTGRDLAVRDFRSRHSAVTEAIGYDKVLMLFHMLRRRLGDERFVRALRSFYAEERFRAASFEDVARAMSRAADEELGPWVAQWVDRPGAPAIRLSGAEARGNALRLTLEQTQEGAPFDVDVPVVVTLAGAPEAVRRTVRLSRARAEVRLEVPGTPVRVDVDPEFDVFRRLDPREVPPALSGALGAGEVVIVLPSAAPPARRAAYQALADAWKRKGTTVVSDDRLERLPAGKGVWILGWDNRFRDAIEGAAKACGAELAATGVRAGSVSLPREARVAVLAVRSPADPAQVAAFVGADDPRAVPGLARKLPHYGKYGLLGFDGVAPENVAKEVWPALASPMAAAVGGGELPPRGALPRRKALADAAAR